MKKSLLATASVTALLCMSFPAFSASDAECEKEFTAADANNDGALSQTEGRRFFAAMRTSNRMTPNDRIDKPLFLEHCKADAFVIKQPDAGAPLEGANSFTENQAKDRIEAAGFSDVSGLSKDDKGIWRGTAKRGSADVKVAVDYKGNVVSQ
jgi:hypothetical protein